MPMFDEETPITEEQWRFLLNRSAPSILGSSRGGGKNFALELYAKQQEALGNKVVILKPEPTPKTVTSLEGHNSSWLKRMFDEGKLRISNNPELIKEFQAFDFAPEKSIEIDGDYKKYLDLAYKKPRDNPFYRRFVLGEFAAEENQSGDENGQ